MEDYQSIGESEIYSFHTAQSIIPDASLPGRVGEEQVKQAVRTAAESILRDIPLRLFNTRDGKIYTNKALITKFMESEQCLSLLGLTTTLDQIAIQFINEVVRRFFAYAMLSHRWEDDELAFKDVKEQSVYDLPAARFHKVHHFCHQAGECGLDWAWVDTCCIDQRSSAEVQRTISSMFSWYRGSALTIIYLSDVTESSVAALLDSQWFKRGWTLQELLAAKVVRIYKKNWSPFIRGAVFNHKDIAEILDALETATGIEQCYLKSYSPSVEHPRMKLTWARNRKTKETEDEAYCLMGTFGITMTVTYGEGDDAFARLLKEIMKRTGDATLLDWVGQRSSMNSYLPSSPRCFSDGPLCIQRSKMVFADPVWSLSLVAKIMLVFKKGPRRAKRNREEPSGNESLIHAIKEPVLPTNGAPQITHARSGQSTTRSKRYANTPVEVSLGQLLEEPPGPYELTPDIDLIVPCFTHKVLSLYFERDSNAYVCEADGVQKFSLVTSETLKTQIFGHNPSSGYLLVRTWDPHLSYASSESSTLHSSLQLLRQRLAIPFFAMLLEPSNHGRFRRISTEERIVAQLEQPPSQTYGVRYLRIH